MISVQIRGLKEGAEKVVVFAFGRERRALQAAEKSRLA
jgi:hypothetical protein